MYNPTMSHEAGTRPTGPRSDWTVRKYALGQEPGDDLSASTTAEQRLAMMWSLALRAWALTGSPLPDYQRANSPVVVRRPTP
jgi:hypothetical protein